MRVLIGCEESQVVCKAFRERGHEAYSCDLLPCSGGHPEWHIQGDVFFAIMERSYDLIILHPPCTALAVSGNRYYGEGMPRNHERIKAIGWTLALWELAVVSAKMVALENPVGVLSKTGLGVPQYIQPWQFGEDASKKTGLWLHNLPPLMPTVIVPPTKGGKYYSNQTPSGQNRLGPSADRAKIRSKTYQGIANAMAEQWGSL